VSELNTDRALVSVNKVDLSFQRRDMRIIPDTLYVSVPFYLNAIPVYDKESQDDLGSRQRASTYSVLRRDSTFRHDSRSLDDDPLPASSRHRTNMDEVVISRVSVVGRVWDQSRRAELGKGVLTLTHRRDPESVRERYTTDRHRLESFGRFSILGELVRWEQSTDRIGLFGDIAVRIVGRARVGEWGEVRLVLLLSRGGTVRSCLSHC